MSLDLSALAALADHCDRCDGRHTTTLHYPRKIAANHLALGESVEQAADASGMPTTTVGYWAAADAEFRAQVEQRRHSQVQKSTRKLRRATKVIIAELKAMGAAPSTGDSEDGPACGTPNVLHGHH